jgi:hypothetical protein
MMLLDPALRWEALTAQVTQVRKGEFVTGCSTTKQHLHWG